MLVGVRAIWYLMPNNRDGDGCRGYMLELAMEDGAELSVGISGGWLSVVVVERLGESWKELSKRLPLPIGALPHRCSTRWAAVRSTNVGSTG